MNSKKKIREFVLLEKSTPRKIFFIYKEKITEWPNKVSEGRGDYVIRKNALWDYFTFAKFKAWNQATSSPELSVSEIPYQQVWLKLPVWYSSNGSSPVCQYKLLGPAMQVHSCDILKLCCPGLRVPGNPFGWGLKCKNALAKTIIFSGCISTYTSNFPILLSFSHVANPRALVVNCDWSQRKEGVFIVILAGMNLTKCHWMAVCTWVFYVWVVWSRVRVRPWGHLQFCSRDRDGPLIPRPPLIFGPPHTHSPRTCPCIYTVWSLKGGPRICHPYNLALGGIPSSLPACSLSRSFCKVSLSPLFYETDSAHRGSNRRSPECHSDGSSWPV